MMGPQPSQQRSQRPLTRHVPQEREARNSRFDWTVERKVALLKQVLEAGDEAFKTFKDGSTAAKNGHTQKWVWTNEENGILPMVMRDDSMQGASLPSYASVIASLKGWVQVCLAIAATGLHAWLHHKPCLGLQALSHPNRQIHCPPPPTCLPADAGRRASLHRWQGASGAD